MKIFSVLGASGQERERMNKQEFIMDKVKNGVHAPTAGIIFENVREIQLLKERIDELEKRADIDMADKIASESEIKPEKIKKTTKTPTKKKLVTSVEKSDEDY